MNRRLLTILLPVAAATLTAGCTTFSDNDVVARIGGTELSQSALDGLLADQGAQLDQLGGTLPLEQTRPVITQWIQQTILDAELFTPEMLQDVSDDVLANGYRDGLDVAGVTCPLLLGTASVGDAEAAADRLRSGADFQEVFESANVNPNFAETDGDSGCIQASLFAPEAREAPDVAALFTLDADNRVVAAESPAQDDSSGGIVFVYRELSELPEEARTQALDALRNTVGIADVLDGLDIHVDPRYGTFDDATASVVALG